MGLKTQPESILLSIKCSFKKEKNERCGRFVQLLLKNSKGNSKTSLLLYKKARLTGPSISSCSSWTSVFEGLAPSAGPRPASACPGSVCFSAGTFAQCPPGLERAAGQHGASSSGLCTWLWRRAGSPSSHSSGHSPYSRHWNELSSSLSRMEELKVL